MTDDDIADIGAKIGAQVKELSQDNPYFFDLIIEIIKTYTPRKDRDYVLPPASPEAR